MCEGIQGAVESDGIVAYGCYAGVGGSQGHIDGGCVYRAYQAQDSYHFKYPLQNPMVDNIQSLQSLGCLD